MRLRCAHARGRPWALVLVLFVPGCRGCSGANEESVNVVDTGVGADTGSTDTAQEPDCLATNVPAGVCVVGEGWDASSRELNVTGVVTRVEASGAGEACGDNVLPAPVTQHPTPSLVDAPWIEVDDGTRKWVVGVTIPGATLDVAVTQRVEVRWVVGEVGSDDSSTFSFADEAGTVVWISSRGAGPLVAPPGFAVGPGAPVCYSKAQADTGIDWSSWSMEFIGPSADTVTLEPGTFAALDDYLVGAPTNVHQTDDRYPPPHYDQVIAFARLPG